MTTKKTIKEMYMEIMEVTGVKENQEYTEFLQDRLEKATKKKSRSGKVNAEKEKEQAHIMELITATLEKMDKPVTITEMQKDSELSEYSNQKLSALLRKLVDNGTVVKISDKRTSKFSLDRGEIAESEEVAE